MTKKRYILFLIFVLSINSFISGQSIRISGRLFDKDEGKIISNGVVFLKPDNQVNTTDQKGEYLFTSTLGRKNITTRVLVQKPESLTTFSRTEYN